MFLFFCLFVCLFAVNKMFVGKQQNLNKIAPGNFCVLSLCIIDSKFVFVFTEMFKLRSLPIDTCTNHISSVNQIRQFLCVFKRIHLHSWWGFPRRGRLFSTIQRLLNMRYFSMLHFNALVDINANLEYVFERLQRFEFIRCWNEMLPHSVKGKLIHLNASGTW